MADTVDTVMHAKQDPVGALLTNNDEPSEQAAREVRRLLVEPTQQRECLDEEIQRLERHLEELKAKRTKVDEAISRYSAIISLIRRIPADVLREIFFHCLDDHRNPVMLETEAPMLLTRICSSWRSIALSSPLLWARIHVAFTNQDLLPDIADPLYEHAFGEYPVPRLPKSRIIEILRLRCEAVEEWLRRSGTCLLSVSIHYTRNQIPNQFGEYHPGRSELSRKLFKTLCRESNRWKHVELSMPMDAYSALAEAFVLSPFNNLITLRMSSPYDWGSRRLNSPPFELVAPNMKRFSINVSDLNLPKITSQWATLTYISIHSSLSSLEAASLLRKCPRLVHLKLSLISKMVEWTPNQTPSDDKSYATYLPELRALHITDESVHPSPNGFYDSIIAPQLMILSFHSESSPARNDATMGVGVVIPSNRRIPPICALLLKSSKLKKLTLDIDCYSCAEMSEVLHSASSVTHLVYGSRKVVPDEWGFSYPASVRGYSGTQWNFKTVFIAGSVERISDNNASEMPLLPHLEKLEFSGSSKVKALSDKNTLQFIIGRMDPSASSAFSLLKAVKITFHQKRQMSIEEGILKHAKDVGVANAIKLNLIYLNVDLANSLLPTSATSGVKQRSPVWNQDRIDEDSTRWVMANDR